VKIAVVLFNLGGPDSPEAVQPFLENLFSDPAIIALPGLVRRPLAKLIASRRAPVARKIYEELGGRSPILAETKSQADALEKQLHARAIDARCFIAMRCWHPLTKEAVAAVREFSPERVVLLPLYPQFSTTTTRSSLLEWQSEARRQKLSTSVQEICCYPYEPGFADALADIIQQALQDRLSGVAYRVVFSAHGLPKRIVEKGDPYQWQVERTVAAVLDRLRPQELDWQISYQSRVGPLEWIGPATDSEIRRAGAEGKSLIVVPVSFVSEHSETLVELDIEYRKVAQTAGVQHYIRVPAVRAHPAFIRGLADLVERALTAERPVTCAPGRICPSRKVCEQERA
jgi:ferrochelatase